MSSEPLYGPDDRWRHPDGSLKNPEPYPFGDAPYEGKEAEAEYIKGRDPYSRGWQPEEFDFELDRLRQRKERKMDKDRQMKLFKIRDSHTADGWHEEGHEIAGLVLNVVGWVVSDDGTWTHISGVRTSNDTYGDGIVVPNSAIIEVLNVVVV